MARILVVDDEPNVRATVARALSLEGHETEEVGDGLTALRRLDGGGIDLALVDLAMPDVDGLGLLRDRRDKGDATPVIILTAHGSVGKAVEALKAGAWDFLEKPADRDRLIHSVANALEHARLARELEDLRPEDEEDAMLGSAPALQELRERIRLAAPSDGRILITGEHGSGKELVARAIHRQSRRRDGPFVKVNCAAVPETLFESELFGHVRGAFTGAHANRKGRFERAHGGTLFLDEVGEIPASMQAKLLRAIETGEVERVGGNGEFHVDARVIAATNRDLEREITLGRFREDLYYRLNVVPIRVPPLRERKGDLPALAARFLEDCCRRNGAAAKRLAPESLRLISTHDFPGNVRELRNLMERLAILAAGPEIGAAEVIRHLPAGAQPSSPPAGDGVAWPAAGQGNEPLKLRLEEFERVAIRTALQEHGWRMAEAARALGLERSHLYKKMKGLGIQKP